MNNLFVLPDISRVMVWAKDVDGIFVYVNKCFAFDFLDAEDVSEPIGKTGGYFAIRQGDQFTFAKICQQSDEFVLVTQQPTQTIETGMIKGEQKTCAIYKWPLLNPKLAGTIGIAFYIEGDCAS